MMGSASLNDMYAAVDRISVTVLGLAVMRSVASKNGGGGFGGAGIGGGGEGFDKQLGTLR